MAEINMITLPTLNGEIQIGCDAIFLDEQKLPILVQAGKPATLNQVKLVAAHWASTQDKDPTVQKWLVNGVCALIDMGMICTVNNIPDGAWKKVDNYVQIEQDAIQEVFKMINLEMMIKTVTMVVSTKAHFWQTNYHTGYRYDRNSYIYSNDFIYFFNNGLTHSQLEIRAARLLGHFASTLKVLQMAGLQNLRKTEPFVHNAGASLTLSDNIKLRFQSMPAGTERLAIAFETAMRLAMSPYAKYCPGLQDFHVLPIIRNRIMADPVRYHIRALYLTGQPRAKYRDTDFKVYLGRLGTFMNTMYIYSTLTKSKYMQSFSKYGDYDQNFKNVLMRIKKAVDHGSNIKDEPTAVDVTPAVIKGLRNGFLPNLDGLNTEQDSSK